MEDNSNITSPEGNTEIVLEPFEAKMYGMLDHKTLEMMLCGYLIKDDNLATVNPNLCSTKNADRLIEVGINGKMFENESLGSLFDELIGYYKTYRELSSLEDGEQKAITFGSNHDQAMMYGEYMSTCHGVVIARRININLLIERFKNHFYCKKADSIYQKFVKDRGSIGPRSALNDFRQSCRINLNDPEGETIKEYDLGKNADDTIGWLLDIKHNPEKYKGCLCGIEQIDIRTTGFQKGQLTVIVGKHGGYKSTTMINIAHGLFTRGYNVLYVSLEMDAKLLMAMLYCRYTRKLYWSKLYSGLISEPEDWKKREKIAKKMSEEDITTEEKEKYKKELSRLNEILSGSVPGNEDILIINNAIKEINSRENRIVINNIGQSKKIKVSQIEKWIEEKRESWQPDVVLVDYLALVDSDQKYSDRRDLEVGDVCKHFRAMGARMGFHVITAAQYKRAAIDRIRKYGFNNPEKAMLGTDDIAESNQIGADADTVFMLWPEDGGNRIRIFVPKARHAASDPEKGSVVEVDQNHCTIADDIGSTMEISETVPFSVGIESAKRLLDGTPLAPAIPENNDDFDSFLSDSEPVEEKEFDFL